MQKIIYRLGQFSLKYLYVWGAGLLSMGLMMGAVSDRWWPLPIPIILVGGSLVIIWLYWWLSRNGWFRSAQRRLLTQSLIFIALLIAVNSLIVRNAWRLDLTENQLFTLSSQTQQLVKSLPQPLKVWVFSPQPPAQMSELLIDYQKLNPQFQYEFARFGSDIAQKFKVEVANEVHLEFGRKQQLLARLNPGQSLTENILNAGIEKITSDRQEQVYLLQGHGEPGLEVAAIKALQAKNYPVKPLVLAQAPIPTDTTLLALIGSQKPLLPAEVQSIDQYLSKGGRLLILADPKVQLGLDALLKKWGIQLSNYLAIDPTSARQSTGLDPQIAIVTDYGEHPITQSFGNGISIYPQARPLIVQPTAGVQAIPLLTTSDQSWATIPTANPALQFQKGQDLPGPLILGVAAQKANSRLVVIGSSLFIRDGIFNQQLNSDVLLNSVGWLSERRTLASNPKEITNRRINLSWWQSQLLFWLPIVLLPGASLTTAAVLWWQRR